MTSSTMIARPIASHCTFFSRKLVTFSMVHLCKGGAGRSGDPAGSIDRSWTRLLRRRRLSLLGLGRLFELRQVLLDAVGHERLGPLAHQQRLARHLDLHDRGRPVNEPVGL